MLLAADVGGTKSLVGLYAPSSRSGSGPRWRTDPPDGRPTPQVMREFATLDFDSLEDLVATFVDETGESRVDAVCIGIAGPEFPAMPSKTSVAT